MRKITGYILITCLLLSTYSCEGIFDNLEGLSKMTVEDMLSTETIFWEFWPILQPPMSSFSTGDRVHFLPTRAGPLLHTVRAVSAAIGTIHR